MAKRKTYLGSVNLTALKHETVIRNGKKGIFIPVEENPSIYFKAKDDGTKTINLDIEVKPTADNRYGNSHLIKLNVGKENRQKYNLSKEQMANATPIVGNLKEFEFNTPDDAPAGGGNQGGGSSAPAEFDGNW